MTREDLLKTIRLFLDARFLSGNHEECAEKLLSEYDKQIKVEAIDELGKVLCDELDKGYTFMNKHQILHFTELLKEQNSKIL